jgi:hypothetical protein
MLTKWIGRLVVAATISTGSLCIAILPVSAANGPAYTGACNMLLAGSGMANAMYKDTLHGQGANGNGGMYGAITASTTTGC